MTCINRSENLALYWTVTTWILMRRNAQSTPRYWQATLTAAMPLMGRNGANRSVAKQPKIVRRYIDNGSEPAS